MKRISLHGHRHRRARVRFLRSTPSIPPTLCYCLAGGRGAREYIRTTPPPLPPPPPTTLWFSFTPSTMTMTNVIWLQRRELFTSEEQNRKEKEGGDEGGRHETVSQEYRGRLDNGATASRVWTPPRGHKEAISKSAKRLPSISKANTSALTIKNERCIESLADTVTDCVQGQDVDGALCAVRSYLQSSATRAGPNPSAGALSNALSMTLHLCEQCGRASDGIALIDEVRLKEQLWQRDHLQRKNGSANGTENRSETEGPPIVGSHPHPSSQCGNPYSVWSGENLLSNLLRLYCAVNDDAAALQLMSFLLSKNLLRQRTASVYVRFCCRRACGVDGSRHEGVAAYAHPSATPTRQEQQRCFQCGWNIFVECVKRGIALDVPDLTAVGRLCVAVEAEAAAFLPRLLDEIREREQRVDSDFLNFVLKPWAALEAQRWPNSSPLSPDSLDGGQAERGTENTGSPLHLEGEGESQPQSPNEKKRRRKEWSSSSSLPHGLSVTQVWIPRRESARKNVSAAPHSFLNRSMEDIASVHDNNGDSGLGSHVTEDPRFSPAAMIVVCPHCRRPLQKQPFTVAQRDGLLSAVEHQIVLNPQGRRRAPTPSEAETIHRHFRHWKRLLQHQVDHGMPYDLLIDGANVGYYGLSKWYDVAKAREAGPPPPTPFSTPGQSTSSPVPSPDDDACSETVSGSLPPPSSRKGKQRSAVDVQLDFPLIDQALQMAMSVHGFKRPLILLHQRHCNPGRLSPQNAALLAAWQQAKRVYTTPHGANDDGWWLYAALFLSRAKDNASSPFGSSSSRPSIHQDSDDSAPVWSGGSMEKRQGTGDGGVFVLTNDLLRDHLFKLLSPRSLTRWREHYCVRFRCERVEEKTHLVWEWPPPYSRAPQERTVRLRSAAAAPTPPSQPPLPWCSAPLSSSHLSSSFPTPPPLSSSSVEINPTARADAEDALCRQRRRETTTWSVWHLPMGEAEDKCPRAYAKQRETEGENTKYVNGGRDNKGREECCLDGKSPLTVANHETVTGEAQGREEEAHDSEGQNDERVDEGDEKDCHTSRLSGEGFITVTTMSSLPCLSPPNDPHTAAASDAAPWICVSWRRRDVQS